jgi:hypothetical protein
MLETPSSSFNLVELEGVDPSESPPEKTNLTLDIEEIWYTIYTN